MGGTNFTNQHQIEKIRKLNPKDLKKKKKELVLLPEAVGVVAVGVMVIIV